MVVSALWAAPVRSYKIRNHGWTEGHLSSSLWLKPQGLSKFILNWGWLGPDPRGGARLSFRMATIADTVPTLVIRVICVCGGNGKGPEVIAPAL